MRLLGKPRYSNGLGTVPVLRLRIPRGISSFPNAVSYNGKQFNVSLQSSQNGTVNERISRAEIPGLPFMADKPIGVDIEVDIDVLSRKLTLSTVVVEPPKTIFELLHEKKKGAPRLIGDYEDREIVNNAKDLAR